MALCRAQTFQRPQRRELTASRLCTKLGLPTLVKENKQGTHSVALGK